MQRPHSLTLILGLLLLAFFVSLQPDLVKNALGLDKPVALPAANCDVGQAPCRYVLPQGGSITLNILPRPIQAVEPMLVDIQLEGVEGISAGVDFAGADMAMGFNVIPLIKQDSTQFATQTSLPICTTGKMQWVATLQLETNKALLHIPFKFEVGK
jgi:hypothetical protein